MTNPELDKAKSLIYKVFSIIDNANTRVYTLDENEKKVILQELEHTPVQNYPDSEHSAWLFIRSIMC